MHLQTCIFSSAVSEVIELKKSSDRNKAEVRLVGLLLAFSCREALMVAR